MNDLLRLIEATSGLAEKLPQASHFMTAGIALLAAAAAWLALAHNRRVEDRRHRLEAIRYAHKVKIVAGRVRDLSDQVEGAAGVLGIGTARDKLGEEMTALRDTLPAAEELSEEVIRDPQCLRKRSTEEISLLSVRLYSELARLETQGEALVEKRDDFRRMWQERPRPVR